jgi:acyl-CoA reductase-like NAD-dependent aldehyde dehydrogenase
MRLHEQEVVPVVACSEKLRGGAETLERAREAQRYWKAQSVTKRLRVITAFRHLAASSVEELARATGTEGGKSAEALVAEVLPLLDACKFLEREAAAILGRLKLRSGRPLWLFGTETQIYREPYGVVLLIGPSNYPLLLPGVQLMQALVAGNAVLLKPGTGAGPAALLLAKLLERAGLPADLLAVLDESPETSAKFIEMPVDKVLFTGSAKVGTTLLSRLAGRAIPATMELSGHDPVLVCADAELDLAAKAIAFGLTLNWGQTCIAPRRVFVARSVATELEGRVAEALGTARQVALSGPESTRLAQAVMDALNSGAHLLAGRLTQEGRLIGPVAVAGLAADSPLLQQEYFGPLMTMVTVEDEDQGLELAGRSRLALGATIFSRDLERARSLAEELTAGVVVLNDMIVPTADPRVPFGGRKLSGFGVTRGREGLLELTTPKVVCVRRGNFRPHYRRAGAAEAKLFTDWIRLRHGRGWRQRLRAMAGLFCDAWAQARR